jgi:hypothetical protein
MLGAWWTWCLRLPVVRNPPFGRRVFAPQDGQKLDLGRPRTRSFCRDDSMVVLRADDAK